MPIPFSTLCQSSTRKPGIVITIEGIGEYAGIWKFCSKVPDYAIGNALYKPWIKRNTLPVELAEKINILGGVADSGELIVELIDGEGFAAGPTAYNAITAKFRDDATQDFYLSTGVTAGATTVTILGPAANLAAIIPGTTMFFIGTEAMRCVSLSAGTTYNVTRAQLDTDANSHDANASVFIQSPFIHGRRMRYYLFFDDPGTDVTVETEQGSGWFIDGEELGEFLASYRLTGKSMLKHVDRLLMNKRNFVGTVLDRAIGQGSVDSYATLADILSIRFLLPGAHQVSDGGGFRDFQWFQIGGDNGELAARSFGASYYPDIDAFYSSVGIVALDTDLRGQAGTARRDITIGDDCRQAFVADTSFGGGSFRYQERGAETSLRTSGTWLQSNHPIPILLNLLCSSSDVGDGLAVTNWSAGTGNFSALPVGVGVGIPQSKINFPSFFSVWERNPDWSLPNLRLVKAESCRDYITREILLPFGIILYSQNGVLYARILRTPTTTATGTSWNTATILTEEVERGHRAPLISARQNTSLIANSIVFKLRGNDGTPVELIFNDSTFPEIFGDIKGYYARDTGRIEITVNGVSPDALGDVQQLKKRALHLLWRLRRPPWEVDLKTGLDQLTVNLSDPILFTYPELPLKSSGTRGWTARLSELTSKLFNVQTGQIAWKLISYASAGRFGVIAPSAYIISISTNTLACAANRFTDVNAGSGLPTTDVGAFAVGDVVRTRLVSGANNVTAPTSQIIQSINTGASTITLDGNFGGATMAGRVLVYAPYDSSTTIQQTGNVYYSSTSETIGAVADAAYTYGEN